VSSQPFLGRPLPVIAIGEPSGGSSVRFHGIVLRRWALSRFESRSSTGRWIRLGWANTRSRHFSKYDKGSRPGPEICWKPKLERRMRIFPLSSVQPREPGFPADRISHFDIW